MEKVKLCKDCKNYLLNDDWNAEEYKREFAICRLSITDPINGRGLCQNFRKGGKWIAKFEGLCGKEGRFWEAKT